MKTSQELIYRNAKTECLGKPADWIRQGINEVMDLMSDQIRQDGKVPNEEQLDRIEAVLRALKDELKARGEE